MKRITATECRRRVLIHQAQFDRDMAPILAKLQEQFVQPVVDMCIKRLLEIMEEEQKSEGICNRKLSGKGSEETEG